MRRIIRGAPGHEPDQSRTGRGGRAASGEAAIGDGDADEPIEMRGLLEPRLDATLVPPSRHEQRIQGGRVDEAHQHEGKRERVSHAASIDPRRSTGEWPIGTWYRRPGIARPATWRT